MSTKNKAFLILTAVFLVILGFSQDSHAYLDPGTGSMIVQMVVGAIAAAGVALKLYWSKIKSLFVKSASSNTEQNPKD